MIPTDPKRRGGTMLGPDDKCYFTEHTFEGFRVAYRMTAEEGAARLIRAGTTPHFCGSIITGGLVQMLPANVSAYTLENAPGGVETNRAGRIHMQIEMLAEAREPWTEYATPEGWAMVARLMDFLESWGIPRVWPAGRPAATSGGPHNRIGPGPSGHYGHSQWRDQPSRHWDPGAVDTVRILGATAVSADPDVLARQKKLVEVGLLKPSDVDGIDGPITQKAWAIYMDIIDLLTDIKSGQQTILEGIRTIPHAVWDYRSKGRTMDFYVRFNAGGIKTDVKGNEVPVPIAPPPLDPGPTAA